MKKTIYFCLCCAWSVLLSAQNFTSFFTGSQTDLITDPIGGVCLMGGATEDDNAMRWFLNRASGGDILVLRASGSDGYNDYLYTELGLNVNSVETIVFNNAQAANEAYVQERISQAEAIWIAGGDQANYVNYWRSTPVATLINEAIDQRNIVIGGTSAGMAILGGSYFSAQNGTVTSAQALSDPYNSRMQLSNAPFLRVPYLDRIITDTHYDDPDRKGRHVAFLARAITDYGVAFRGIACDEYTAVCIDGNGTASVYGTYPDFDDNAYFLAPNCNIDNNQPEQCSSGNPLIWDQGTAAVKVYAIKGTPTGLYTFDLNTWEIGDGGDWQDWSVSNNSLTENMSNEPACSPVSTTTLAARHSLTVYPNPSPRGVVQLNSSSQIPAQVSIYDTNGQLLQQWSSVQSSSGINTENLAVGVYILEYVNAEMRQVRRMVIR